MMAAKAPFAKVEAPCPFECGPPPPRDRGPQARGQRKAPRRRKPARLLQLRVPPPPLYLLRSSGARFAAVASPAWRFFCPRVYGFNCECRGGAEPALLWFLLHPTIARQYGGRAAEIVDPSAILKGAKEPGNIPVEQPTKFFFRAFVSISISRTAQASNFHGGTKRSWIRARRGPSE